VAAGSAAVARAALAMGAQAVVHLELVATVVQEVEERGGAVVVAGAAPAVGSVMATDAQAERATAVAQEKREGEPQRRLLVRISLPRGPRGISALRAAAT